MTISYAGSLTLGECVPMALLASARLDAAVGSSLPDLQARLAGLLQVSISPPPSIADLIAQAQALLVALQNLLALPPVLDVAATAVAIAELQASIGALNASLTFSADLAAFLAAPGVHFYAFAGRAAELGLEFQAQLSSGLPGSDPNAHVAGVAMLASDGGAITALQTVLRS